MKVLIVSDIHCGYKYMKKVFEDNTDFDMMLILGDILAGPVTDFKEELIALLNSYSEKIIAVRGNCDGYDVESLAFPVKDIYNKYMINHKLVFMTHGHEYSRSHLPELDFDIFMSGHTHIPVMERVGDKLFLNPGSITLPKGMSNNSYIRYEDGVFYLMDLINNTVIKSIEI
jgi:putative phosphoesterase